MREITKEEVVRVLIDDIIDSLLSGQRVLEIEHETLARTTVLEPESLASLTVVEGSNVVDYVYLRQEQEHWRC